LRMRLPMRLNATTLGRRRPSNPISGSRRRPSVTSGDWPSVEAARAV
jgi:hypothetical protein